MERAHKILSTKELWSITIQYIHDYHEAFDTPGIKPARARSLNAV